VKMDDTKFFSWIDSSNAISAKTKQSYRKHLRSLKSHFPGTNIATIIERPGAVQQLHISDSLKSAYATVVLSLYKRAKENGTPLDPKHYDAWSRVQSQAYDTYLKKVESNALTREESENWASWDEWKDMDELLSKVEPGSPTQLLVAFHVRIVPLRGGDLTYVRFCNDKDCERVKGNIITNITNSHPSVMYISEHKTAKTYGTLTREIPDDLKKEVRMSYFKNPREFLFVRPDGKGYTSTSAFIDWKRNVFRRLFDRNVTTNSARHAYVSSGDFNSLSVAEQKQRALEMGHSFTTHHDYRKLT